MGLSWTRNTKQNPYTCGPVKITEVEVTEADDYDRRMHVCNRLSRGARDGVLEPKRTFFANEA